MHDIVRDLFMDFAPRKWWQVLVASCALLSVIGVAGPMNWLVSEMVDAAMDKAKHVQQQLESVLVDLLTPDTPASPSSR